MHKLQLLAALLLCVNVERDKSPLAAGLKTATFAASSRRALITRASGSPIAWTLVLLTSVGEGCTRELLKETELFDGLVHQPGDKRIESVSASTFERRSNKGAKITKKDPKILENEPRKPFRINKSCQKTNLNEAKRT
jgi:hypothetical protein